MKYLFLVLMAIGFSCGEKEDREEEVKKLRTLGVKTDPVVLETPQVGLTRTATVLFYFAVPTGKSLTVTPELDSKQIAKKPVELIFDAITGVTYEDIGAFQLATVSTTVNVPFDTKIASMVALNKVAKLSYRLRANISEDPSDEEIVVGDFNVMDSTSPEFQWKNPQIELLTPQQNASFKNSSEQSVEARFLQKNDNDPIKVAWFVSSGQIKNRRALSTTWKPSDTGKQTIIITARGTKSRGFDIKKQPVEVIP